MENVYPCLELDPLAALLGGVVGAGKVAPRVLGTGGQRPGLLAHLWRRIT